MEIVPSLAKRLSRPIRRIHSGHYANKSQLHKGAKTKIQLSHLDKLDITFQRLRPERRRSFFVEVFENPALLGVNRHFIQSDTQLIYRTL